MTSKYKRKVAPNPNVEKADKIEYRWRFIRMKTGIPIMGEGGQWKYGRLNFLFPLDFNTVMTEVKRILKGDKIPYQNVSVADLKYRIVKQIEIRNLND